MNKDECRAMCTSPLIPLREKLFFRMMYETTTRPREVLDSRIKLWNRNTGEMLRHYVGNRKKRDTFSSM